jgi:hypothetical protein
MKTEEEQLADIKELKFNSPDIDNLRKNAKEAKKRIQLFEQEMRDAQRVSDKTLYQRFTI